MSCETNQHKFFHHLGGEFAQTGLMEGDPAQFALDPLMLQYHGAFGSHGPKVLVQADRMEQSRGYRPFNRTDRGWLKFQGSVESRLRGIMHAVFNICMAMHMLEL